MAPRPHWRRSIWPAGRAPVTCAISLVYPNAGVAVAQQAADDRWPSGESATGAVAGKVEMKMLSRRLIQSPDNGVRDEGEAGASENVSTSFKPRRLAL